MSNLSDFVPGTGGGEKVEIVQLSEAQTASSNQTVFNLQQISYKTGYEDLKVEVNGVTQEPGGNAYTENSTTQVTTSTALHSNDRIVFNVIRTVESNASIRRYVELQTASEGQTLFELEQLIYTLGYQDLTVEINGATQERSAAVYVEVSSGNQVTLQSPARQGDRLCFSILRMG